MKKLILTIVVVLFMAGVAHGAGTCTQDKSSHGALNIIAMTWTTDGAGAFTATATTWSLNGFVVMVETDPDGTAAPTDDYDLVLNNSGGADIMGGSLADRDTANTEMAMPLLNANYTGIAVQGKLTLGVSNAGNSKTGVVKIYYYAQ